MPYLKGSLSPESIAKMRAAKVGRKTGPHSEEWRAKIAASNRGKVRPKIHQRTCACGKPFASGAFNAVFCSRECGRAARGHGLRHAPAFAHFPKACAICAATEELVGDHDHATGKPRGILCRNCNLAIGNMGDAPARLRAAADYLEQQ